MHAPGDGAHEEADGEQQKQVVSLHFDLGPEDDVGLKVMEACERHGLSADGCDAVMQQVLACCRCSAFPGQCLRLNPNPQNWQVGVRFSDYQGSTRAQLASMSFAQACLPPLHPLAPQPSLILHTHTQTRAGARRL